MPLTDPSAIPAGKRPIIKEVVMQIGPQILGNKFPQVDGAPATDLTTQEVGEVFEKITREFWRQNIAAFEAEKAATVARDQAIEANKDDPFV
jgi:hypothetical protein